MSFMDRHIKDSTVIVILALIVLSAGIIIGSVSLVHTGADASASLQNYLTEFLKASREGINPHEVFKTALRENIIYFAIVFIAGFFRIGLVFIAAALVRKGFIIGFTSAAFIQFYGMKGLLMTISMLPGIVLIIPAFLFLSAVSADMAVHRTKKEKNFLIYYIFFALAIISIFCVSALAEGYLTTIFMKMLSPKMIH